jgi:hypothetical protein
LLEPSSLHRLDRLNLPHPNRSWLKGGSQPFKMTPISWIDVCSLEVEEKIVGKNILITGRING